MVRKILVLTANPNDTSRLRADQEMQSVQERLRRSNQRNQFEIIFQCARPDTLLDVIEDERPEVVHFCGHGTEEGLVLESESGRDSHLVRTQALKMLFRRVSGYVKCVLLNACYSETHAEAISEYIPYTIGMEGAIWDRAAIAFAGAFYKDLGDGRSIESAFERGRVVAHLINPDEEPKLFQKKRSDFLYKIWQDIQYNFFRVAICLKNFFGSQGFLIGLVCLGIVITVLGFPWLYQVSLSWWNTIVNPPLPVEALCGESGSQTLEQHSQISSPSQEKGLFSSGENVLLTYRNNFDLIKKGTDAFKKVEQNAPNHDYDTAVKLFQDAIDKDPNNPEAYIYRNNSLARIKSKRQGYKLYVLAAAIPSSNVEERTRAEEMLRGIADAQACFNDASQTNCFHDPKGNLLEIRLVDDSNDPDVVSKVAREIADNSESLGVIGHYSSSATEVALPAYSQYKLAVISPSSTSSSLKNEVFFRTVPSSTVLGSKLATYAKQRKNITQVIGFIDSSDKYSNSLWSDFKSELQKPQLGQNKLTVKEIELSRDSDVREAINYINSNEGSLVVLIPPSTKTQNFASERDSFDRTADIAKNISRSSGNIIIGGNALYTSKVLNPDFEGMILVVPWFAKASDAATSYAERAKNTWGGQVSWVTAGSYDATQSFMQALSSITDISLDAEVLNLDTLLYIKLHKYLRQQIIAPVHNRAATA